MKIYILDMEIITKDDNRTQQVYFTSFEEAKEYAEKCLQQNAYYLCYDNITTITARISENDINENEISQQQLEGIQKYGYADMLEFDCDNIIWEKKE